MLKDDTEQYKMSHFMGRRVVYSGAVLIIIIVAIAFGFMEPNSNPFMLTKP